MALGRLEISDFRCLRSVQLTCDPGLNVVSGANASGKTSLLEAIWFLGRGRSFRSRRRDSLVRQASAGLSVFAEINTVTGQVHRLGAGYAAKGLRARLNGETVRAVSVLAHHLPVQLIDPHVHRLIEGGPGERRQFLDWGLFHVEQGFLDDWTRFRKALRQRNALLRHPAKARELPVWESQLADNGESLSASREDYVRRLQPLLQETVKRILGDVEVELRYQRGWPAGETLLDALARLRASEHQSGVTRSGPHRGDVEILIDGVAAAERVSRGQEKILASCMVLAQQQLYAQASGDQGVLLLDDLASELDQRYLSRFMAVLCELPAQKFLTVISAEVLSGLLPLESKMFHVEQGKVSEVIQ